MLEGIGEPFHEVRELIKDLRFRNAQEAEIGRLAIVERYLALGAQAGLLSSADIAEVLARTLAGGEVRIELARALASPRTRDAAVELCSSRGPIAGIR